MNLPELRATAPRRVTVVAHELRGFLPVGGMGTATTFLALALARLGHDVEILLGIHDPASVDPYWREVYDGAGVRIRAAPLTAERVEPWPFLHPRSIELALREDEPEVVVAHDFGGPVATALGVRQAGVAFADTLFVVFCHGPRRYVLDRSPTVAVGDLRHVLGVGLLEQTAVELADAVVSPSAYLLDWMRAAGWRLPERSLVIPHLSRADATGEHVSIQRPPAGVPLERLTFFGRIDERKGLLLLAEALGALEPELLAGVELELLGRASPSWPQERVEALLPTDALRGVSFRTGLDQHEALSRLAGPGTLAVMPSLQENSPNTVYECLELGIPFVASDVGGVPELVAPEDRERTLFPPTAVGLEAALRRVLADGRVPAPVRPAFDAAGSFARWQEVLDQRPAAPPTAPVDYVLVRDEEDIPDPELEPTLARALESSGADAVTCGVRVRDELRFYYGDPGGLGALENAYGTTALVRRAAAGAGGAAWPRLADIAAAGGRIVSVPIPLARRRSAPASVRREPAEALVAVDRLDRSLPAAARGAARLAAGLEADAQPSRDGSGDGRLRDVVRRLLRRGTS